MNEKIPDICRQFGITGRYISCEEINVGNINRTYKANWLDENGTPVSYMIQRVNTYVFRKPEQVMENISNVTEYIRAKKPEGTSLYFHHTADGKTFITDEDGFWRLFNYIPSCTYDLCDDLDVVRSAAAAFGEFQTLLSDFDASKLYETIPDFHNTVKRYDDLISNSGKDPCGRANEVREELDWLLSVKDRACTLTRMKDAGLLPLRVTHNDTKINNVLFDRNTKKALTVIDLDTVMPGLVGHDFGDAIRSAANFVEEDSREYEKAGVDLDIFSAFAEGFIKKTVNILTENELDTLALGCFVLTCEQAVRFLDDYINGDKYYKIKYPDHNLVRTRCQVALAKDMLTKMDRMETIVRELSEKYRQPGP